MNTRILILSLAAIATTSCNQTVATIQPEQVNQISKQLDQAPTSTPLSNPFDSVSFPKDSCGDKLPTDQKAYPVKIYPVFIEYSEINFRAVTSKYCRDSLNKFRKETGKYAIQVGSFLSVEQANQFKYFLQDKLGSGEVGNPTLLEAKQASNRIPISAHTKDTIAKASLLTHDQAKRLISISKNVRLENGEIGKFEIVVPTYIPPGFKLDHLKTSGEDYPYYYVNYRNSNNVCFSFSAFTSPGASSPGEYDTVEVSAPAFEKVTLTYTNFDDNYNKPLVASYLASNRRNKEVGKYNFYSGNNSGKNCNTINLKAAVKIVESLQFIKP